MRLPQRTVASCASSALHSRLQVGRYTQSGQQRTLARVKSSALRSTCACTSASTSTKYEPVTHVTVCKDGKAAGGAGGEGATGVHDHSRKRIMIVEAEAARELFLLPGTGCSLRVWTGRMRQQRYHTRYVLCHGVGRSVHAVEGEAGKRGEWYARARAQGGVARGIHRAESNNQARPAHAALLSLCRRCRTSASMRVVNFVPCHAPVAEHAWPGPLQQCTPPPRLGSGTPVSLLYPGLTPDALQSERFPTPWHMYTCVAKDRTLYTTARTLYTTARGREMRAAARGDGGGG